MNCLNAGPKNGYTLYAASFIGFWRHLDRFFKERTEEYAQIPSMIDCSLKSLPKIGMFLIHRLPDQTVRQELYDVFLDEYRIVFMLMCDNVAGCIDQLIRDYDLAAAPVSVPE